ncbi:MAG: S8 family peptidase [Treponema sp.]|nr:S8 family peptidase [Treponema sp.]
MSKRILFAQPRILADASVDRKPSRQPRHTPRKAGSSGETQKSLIQQLEALEQAIAKLPTGACPGDYVVLVLVLHPEESGSIDFPVQWLPGARILGSRPSRKGPGTINCYMAVQKQYIAALAEKVRNGTPDLDRFLACFVSINLLGPEHRLKKLGNVQNYPGDEHFEIALHIFSDGPEGFPLEAFCAYAQEVGFRVKREHRFLTQQLLFVPVRGPLEKLPDLARFTFIRQIQEVPRMRPFISRRQVVHKELQLPLGEPLSQAPRVAIFDGGLPEAHPIDHFITQYVPLNPDAETMPGGEEHGLGVTSAFLFGPLQPAEEIKRPYAPVAVFRLVDSNCEKADDLHMYQSLEYIRQILTGGGFEFVNISVAPQISAEDHDVHAWTTVLDELACKEGLFITVAGGNNGSLSNPRIEVPGDGVNIVSVGAADRQGQGWKRAPYAAQGPDRSPALVKPDMVVFGGSDKDPFRVLAPGEGLCIATETGTSFAAPYLLRHAVGLRVLGGEAVSVLTIRALLIHYADRGGNRVFDVGWGCPPPPEVIIAGFPGEIRLIYQGKAAPGYKIQADVPVPDADFQGPVRIEGTFCYMSPVSHHDPVAYTKTALDIDFISCEDVASGRDSRFPVLEFFDMADGNAPGRGLTRDQYPEILLKATVKSGEHILDARDVAGAYFEIRRVDSSDKNRHQRGHEIAYSLVITVTKENTGV